MLCARLCCKQGVSEFSLTLIKLPELCFKSIMSIYVLNCIVYCSVTYQAIFLVNMTTMMIILITLCTEVADPAARTTFRTIICASWRRETATAWVCVASPARVRGDSLSRLAPCAHHHRSCQWPTRVYIHCFLFSLPPPLTPCPHILSNCLVFHQK